jgi:hypothetical protein
MVPLMPVVLLLYEYKYHELRRKSFDTFFT